MVFRRGHSFALAFSLVRHAFARVPGVEISIRSADDPGRVWSLRDRQSDASFSTVVAARRMAGGVRGTIPCI